MSHSFLASIGARAAVIATVSLAPALVAGQATTAAAQTGTPPRTPWGAPDLQGIWSFAILTPLERPNELAGKQVLTEEEAAALERRTSERNVDRPPPSGNPGGYNQFWLDWGTKVGATKRTSLIEDPPDGKIPPLTPEGEKRAAARLEAEPRPPSGPEDRPVYERCILGFNSGPPMIPSGYNNNVQLVQTREYVVILNEMVHNARVVPLDGRPHLPPRIRQWAGDPRGHWEGDTLVVETVNFNFTDKGISWAIGPNSSSALRGVSTDEKLHLVERFTRVDEDTLLYEFTIDDPTVWTRPWTATVPMANSQDLIYEYACHEGNYGLMNILKGARVEEKAAEEAAKKPSK